MHMAVECVAVEKIQHPGRQIFEALVAQRPHRRPFDLGRRIERRRRRRHVRFTRSDLRTPVLFVAEQQDVIRCNGVARREVGKSPRHPDLVTLKDAGITLDRLHQRAGFALLGRAALAEAAAAASRAQFMDRLGRPGKIMRGVVVGVERQVDFDPFKLRHHAGERAHVLAVFCHRGPRRNAAVAAAGHDRLGAAGQHERHRLAARIAQLPSSAGWTLRPARHVVLDDGRARQIEADQMIVQRGAETAGDRLGDLDGRKRDAAIAERVLGERRNRDAARVPAVEHRPDLAVPFHPLGETGPARPFAWAEHRPEQGKNAGWLNQQPRRAVGQVLPVQRLQLPFEIIVDHDDREVGGAIDDADTEFAQRRAKLPGTLGIDRLNAHLAFLQIFRRHFQRNAQRRPIAGGGVGSLPFRHDVVAVDQPLDGLVDHVGWKPFRQLADDLAKAFSLGD